VLVADRSPAIIGRLASHLARAGLLVLEAHDGAHALALAKSSRPDVVLIDLELPVLDGYAVIKAIRQDPLLDETTIVAMLSSALTVDPTEAYRAGADACTTRYSPKEELIGTIERAQTLREGAA
jgi:CheY-like chemotaxis protein